MVWHDFEGLRNVSVLAVFGVCFAGFSEVSCGEEAGILEGSRSSLSYSCLVAASSFLYYFFGVASRWL